MRKKRILWVNDGSWKGTGYGVYGKEVLSRLHKVPEFEVAEIACYVDKNDEEISNVPWTVFPNRPLEDAADFENYTRDTSAIFGNQVFNKVLLDFRPDIVMDIRDWWMLEFEERSPFRDFFHWAIMPTVDATPQNPQWLNTFANADSVFAYSEFGRDVMLEQSDKINFIDVASPAAAPEFHWVDNKRAHKESMGIDGDSIIIGTVMRNQRRKLYPDLFKMFRTFLDRTKKSNVFLHCHTYYPDIGWEIPELLNEFGLNNRVLFSYYCRDCEKLTCEFYNDPIRNCDECSEFSRRMVGIINPINTEQLAQIYNCFDLYIQYANSEGFGMPQLEAACCGVPFIATNYSAMESVIKNTGAWPIDPLTLTLECETGCYRAVPDNDTMVDMLEEIMKKPSALRPKGIKVAEQTRKHYDWDKTAQVWIDHFKTIPMKDHSETWESPINIKNFAVDMPENIQDIKSKVDYLFTNVLHKPEWIGGYFWTKVIKDLTFGYRVHNSEEDYYYHESHLPKTDKYQRFTLEMCAKELIALRNSWNDWEKVREHVIRNSQGIK